MGAIVEVENLSGALFGKTRRAVLALLYAHPDEAFYLREVAREADAGQGSVQRELARLTKAGIVERIERGRQVYYQANRACPIRPAAFSIGASLNPTSKLFSPSPFKPAVSISACIPQSLQSVKDLSP